MSIYSIGAAASATITSGLTGLPNALAESVATSIPQLKPVETTASFQKTRTQTGTRELSNDELRYTFCDVDDFNLRPQGNLFQSFRLPTNPADRVAMELALYGTSLTRLANITKFIAIEIPRNKYGELIDGKTIELRIPQASGTSFYSATCYSSFYTFNPDLNTQVSDANPISSILSGIEPTFENDFNTNIAYLFSNDINPPLDSFTTTEAVANQLLDLMPGAPKELDLKGPLTPGTRYKGSLLGMLASLTFKARTALGLIKFSDVLEGYTPGDTTFKVKYEVQGITVQTESKSGFIAYVNLDELKAISTRRWSAWSSQNRFPNQFNGSGKVVANLADSTYQVLADEPIGVAYLDKGFIIITDPTLVNNFDLSDAMTGAEGINTPYSQAEEDKERFTNIFFESDGSDESRSYLKFNSVVTEYTQGYTCLAMPNEFYETTNASYRQVYPAGAGNSAQQPIQITEIGLYNKFGELVAIAKTTKPIQKTKTSVAVFTIGLKI